jgi:hypothetical protein
MKKNILIVALVLFLATYMSNAQLFVDSKASDCFPSAKSYATTNGYTNPELVAIGSTAGDLDANGIKISAKIDIKTGKCTFWLFILKSDAKKDSACYVGVLKTALGTYFTVPVPADKVQQFQVDLTTSLAGINWLDSDKLYAGISKDAGFIAFAKANADATCNLLGLGSVPKLAGSFWMINIIATGGSINCIMDAVSGEVYCVETTTGVNDNITSQISVFPNPTADMVSIYLPTENQSADSKMVLTDYTGKFIMDLNAPKYGETNFTAFRTSDLTNGVYFVRYTSSNGSFVKSFTVVK